MFVGLKWGFTRRNHCGGLLWAQGSVYLNGADRSSDTPAQRTNAKAAKKRSFYSIACFAFYSQDRDHSFVEAKSGSRKVIPIRRDARSDLIAAERETKSGQ